MNFHVVQRSQLDILAMNLSKYEVLFHIEVFELKYSNGYIDRKQTEIHLISNKFEPKVKEIITYFF